jgi:CheY-like chemotaxis protein
MPSEVRDRTEQLTQSFETSREVSAENTMSDSDHPTVLIVEAHPDVMKYIVACLEPLYRLVFAGHGKAGIEVAFDEVPDLIVSDVMMPEMDGFELCRRLRQDPRTDHIPIVLLSARADLESRLSGLKYGADDYLSKPFEPQELIARLENLLAIRKRLQDHFSSGMSEQDTGIQGPQHEFVAELYNAVNKHLDNDTFGVEQLGREVNLGRTQLHKKVKALTGMSASIFIRHVRLTKARELLTSSEMNVSEVSYAVGYHDPKYFSRVYTEKFGEPPSRTSK